MLIYKGVVLIPVAYIFVSINKGLLKGENIMKSTHKTIRFDYSKIIGEEDRRYWGIHTVKGRLHIDTKRYKKMCEKAYESRFIPDGLFKNRSTPYFIPTRVHECDFVVNKIIILINELKNDWFSEYKNAIKAIETPDKTEEKTRLNELMYTCNSADLDEISLDAFFAGVKRMNKYNQIVNSLYYQFVQKVCTEVERYMLLVSTELGYKSNKFDITCFVNFSDGLLKDKKGTKIEKLENYDEFKSLWLVNNFLKHNSVEAYNKLKKNYPHYVHPLKGEDSSIKYENGMYAGNWINIESKYIDNIFDKLIVFFKDYCRVFVKEDVEKASWDYDDYFENAYRELTHLDD